MWLNNEQEKDLVELLALIYNRVPWGKMKTRHYVHDIYNHRVRAASKRSTLYHFTSSLCNYFGLQSLPIDTQEIIDRLRTHENVILNVLAREHIPFCVRAIIRAKELKEQKTQISLFGGIDDKKI